MGTVTCSNCWQRGHNRRGCPALRERMVARIKNDPDDWRARQYFEKKERSKGKNKKCGYCKNPGHQRRTCKELTHAKATAVRLCAEWRKDFIVALKDKGVGIGSLVEFRSYGDPTLGMITDIQWHKLDHRLKFGDGDIHALHVKSIDNLSSQYGATRVPLPTLEDGLTGDCFTSYQKNTIVVSALSGSRVEAQVPTAFLTGEDCIDLIFKESAKASERLEAWEIQEWCPTQGFYN